jgi:hypothetical protein
MFVHSRGDWLHFFAYAREGRRMSEDLDVDDKALNDLDGKLAHLDIGTPTPEPKKRSVSRGRGRPKKPQPEPEPQAELEGEAGGEVAPKLPANEKGRLIRIITELKKKLGAVGSGLEPSLSHSVEELQEEVDLLNHDLDSKRGDQAIKSLMLYVMPVIEMVVTQMVPKDQLDLSTKYHLKNEAEENWVVFEEAAQHIAILHAEWFAIGPWGTLAKATAGCALSCDAKNKAYRARLVSSPQQGQTASATALQ